MYRYGHGGNAVFEPDNENIIDLSANINPLGIPEGAREAIANEAAHINRYPDNFSTDLRECTARFEGVEPDQIFFGSGASDVIFRLPRAIGATKVMLCAPTFSDYERAAQSCGAEIIRYELCKYNGFELNNGFVGAVKSAKPSMVFVCNPNNPTGVLTKAELIKDLLDCCKQIGAWVVVDETFLDFAEEADMHSSKSYLHEYPHLVILKAFTKLFAMPGIRLGYAMCADTELINKLYLHGADWPVSNLAQGAGIAALKDAETYIEQSVKFIAKERYAVSKELFQLGYTVFASKANYIFLQSPYKFDLCDALDKKGIRIRSCDNYWGLDRSYYRIAVSTREHNQKLLTALEEISNEK